MKTDFMIIVLTTLFAIPAMAQTSDEPQKQLDNESVRAIRAILANPEAAAAFSAHTQLMGVRVNVNAHNDTTFIFEGKKLSAGGYRQLFINEQRRFNGDVGTVKYTPNLVP